MGLLKFYGRGNGVCKRYEEERVEPMYTFRDFTPPPPRIPYHSASVTHTHTHMAHTLQTNENLHCTQTGLLPTQHTQNQVKYEKRSQYDHGNKINRRSSESHGVIDLQELMTVNEGATYTYRQRTPPPITTTTTTTTPPRKGEDPLSP